MESMVAKMNAGNAYDVIFPSAKWTQRLIAADKLHKIDAAKLVNAERDLRHLHLLRRPVVRPEVRAQHAVHHVQDRHRLAQGQARRPVRLVERPVERGRAAAARSCWTTATRRSAWRR